MRAGLFLRQAGRGLTWCVVVAGVLVLGAVVAVPRLTGATPFVVLTGSMRPAIDPGDVVVVRPVPPEDLAVGDVITYQLRSGRPEVVTHRVVTQGIGPDGVLLRTRGDANTATDQGVVRGEQVRGVVWYVVPWVGRVTTVLDTGPRRLLSVLLALGLFGYGGRMLRMAHRERRRADRHGDRAAALS